jgi:hypothetical protein
VKGKHRGQPLEAVAREAPDYLQWMLGEPLAEDTKQLVREALAERQAACDLPPALSWEARKALWAAAGQAKAPQALRLSPDDETSRGPTGGR